MSQTLWLALVVVAGLLGAGAVLLANARAARRRQARRESAARVLPTEWSLQPRPVFSQDERRVYRQLREALPHHIVLSKLPLVRFCQPTDTQQVRYWYDLLGTIHVTFAVCSANGRVLAAIDLDTERQPSRRAAQIKQEVLQALRVRHLRCSAGQMPTVAELQLLVPHAVAASRGPQAAPTLTQAGSHLASTVADRRRERAALWQDSGFFQDSFFAPDPRLEGSASEFGSLGGAASRFEGPPTVPGEAADVGGVVIESPGFQSHNTARPHGA